tara:strand:+ start:6827 stop:7306 length:480 start_codon:yes stop_codon:yes gene_type:complete
MTNERYFQAQNETIEEYIKRIQEKSDTENSTEVLVQIARDVSQTIHDAYPNFIGIKGYYSGSDDSGYADHHETKYKDGKSLDKIPSKWCEYIKKFDEIIDNLCWNIPYSITPGMEIDGGCNGYLIIELKDETDIHDNLWHVKVEHTQFIESSDYFEHEL